MFVLSPEYNSASVANGEIHRLSRDARAIGATESLLQTLEMEMVHRRAIETAQLRDLSLGADEAGFSDQFAMSLDGGRTSSWSIRLLDPTSVDVEGAPKEWMTLPALLEMTGGFTPVIEALLRLERSDRLVRVKSIRIDKARGAGDEDGEIDATIELDTVFLVGAE